MTTKADKPPDDDKPILSARFVAEHEAAIKRLVEKATKAYEKDNGKPVTLRTACKKCYKNKKVWFGLCFKCNATKLNAALDAEEDYECQKLEKERARAARQARMLEEQRQLAENPTKPCTKCRKSNRVKGYLYCRRCLSFVVADVRRKVNMDPKNIYVPPHICEMQDRHTVGLIIDRSPADKDYYGKESGPHVPGPIDKALKVEKYKDY